MAKGNFTSVENHFSKTPEAQGDKDQEVVQDWQSLGSNEKAEAGGQAHARTGISFSATRVH